MKHIADDDLVGKRFPWMAFYVGDYMLETIGLTLEEQGAYVRLLCNAWNHNGRLPTDPNELLRAIFPGMHGNKFNRLIPPILDRYFYRDGDCWRHEKVDVELFRASKSRGKAMQFRYGSAKINGLATPTLTLTKIRKK